MLPAGSTLTGIDREMKSLAEATRRSELLGQLPIRFEYMPGDAMVIASPDQGFDLVTCQTLLIHLDRPQDALAEMLRVTKAGGWILCAEPNNLASALSFDSTAWANDLDSLMAGAELQYRVELGKARLHEGFSSAGELVAGWLAAMNVESLQVYLSDKALAMWPPYATPEMAEALAQARKDLAEERWIFTREKTFRYWSAGGGHAARFEQLWRAVMSDFARSVNDMALGTWSAAGGALMYVVAARKGPKDISSP